MLGLLSKTWPLLLFPLIALAMFLGAYFYFYRGGYDPPPTTSIPFDDIVAPESSFSTFTEVPRLGKGTLVVDTAHVNAFTQNEIGVLLSRVADRGYDIEFVGQAGPLSRTQRVFELDRKLRKADSFVVILPNDSYTPQEVAIVRAYVQKGGKLLLMADPTRSHRINSLAESFGISFQPDYLYNNLEHDINFQNIFVRDFRPDPITSGLANLALYTAGSIRSTGTGLAYTDGNTRSSMVERVEPFYPIVKAEDGLVLALADLTFMIPPQNAILDNDRLVSNIADFLTQSSREFELADFPHFFKGDVDILLGRPDIFNIGTDVKSALSVFGTSSEIRGIEDLSRDTIFLGLYQDSAKVAQYLEVAGIHVDDALRTPFTPDIQVDGTAIMLLHKAQERNVLVVLGESGRALLDMVTRLRTGQIEDGLVSDLLGVYRSF